MKTELNFLAKCSSKRHFLEIIIVDEETRKEWAVVQK
jgi:hypothetical protein